MGLGNSSFDKLNAEYGEIRRENERLFDERLEKVYTSFPELRKYDEELTMAELDLAFAKVRGTDPSSLQAKRDELSEKRKKLISDNGIDPGYRERIYTCPKCRDTGLSKGRTAPPKNADALKRGNPRSCLKNPAWRASLKRIISP